MTTENNAEGAAATPANGASTENNAAGEGNENTNANTLMTGDNENGTPEKPNDGEGQPNPQENVTKEPKADGEGDGEGQDPQTSDEPTEYEDFKMPDGMEVNEEVMGNFKGMLTDVGKELGKPLSQEQAQKFVDMGGQLVQEGVEMAMKHAADFHAKRTDEWITKFKEDPDIGGTEEKQKQSLAQAKRVALAIGGDALIEAIDETGAGNHPEVIRAFNTLKDVVGEDGKLIIANQGGGEQTLAQRLYPTQQTQT